MEVNSSKGATIRPRANPPAIPAQTRLAEIAKNRRKTRVITVFTKTKAVSQPAVDHGRGPAKAGAMNGEFRAIGEKLPARILEKQHAQRHYQRPNLT